MVDLSFESEDLCWLDGDEFEMFLGLSSVMQQNISLDDDGDELCKAGDDSGMEVERGNRILGVLYSGGNRSKIRRLPKQRSEYERIVLSLCQ